LWAIAVYIAGFWILDLFKFSDLDLDLDLMTFIYELDWYCMEIYRMCRYELSTLSLSKVLI